MRDSYCVGDHHVGIQKGEYINNIGQKYTGGYLIFMFFSTVECTARIVSSIPRLGRLIFSYVSRRKTDTKRSIDRARTEKFWAMAHQT